MLQTKNLIKKVMSGDLPLTILKGINLEIKPSSTVAIVGPSGAGKSTLLSILAGLDLPSEGEVIYQGEVLSKLDEEQRAEWRLGRVGFVFQNFQLLPSLTAVENVMLPLELAGQKQARKQAEEYLAQVGLKERIKHYPTQLSGGEQQRVAIARAYALKPEILFADEPTGNLDKKTGEAVIQMLFALNEEFGTTLVLVTHDEKLASRCEQVLHVEDGELSELQTAASHDVPAGQATEKATEQTPEEQASEQAGSAQ